MDDCDLLTFGNCLAVNDAGARVPALGIAGDAELAHRGAPIRFRFGRRRRLFGLLLLHHGLRRLDLLWRGWRFILSRAVADRPEGVAEFDVAALAVGHGRQRQQGESAKKKNCTGLHRYRRYAKWPYLDT